MSTAEIVSTVLMGLGALVMLAAAVGVLRFPDVYTRLHAAGKGDTLGQGLILLALMIPAGFGLISLKLLLIVAFIFVFNPTATHALARGAWVKGLEPWTQPTPVPEPDSEETAASDGGEAP